MTNDQEGGELPWRDLGQCHQSVGTSHLLQADAINDIAMSANAPINFFVKQTIPSWPGSSIHDRTVLSSPRPSDCIQC
jgi:hypothetical protein